MFLGKILQKHFGIDKDFDFEQQPDIDSFLEHIQLRMNEEKAHKEILL